MDQAQPSREDILADIATLEAEAARTKVAASNAQSEFERAPSQKSHADAAIKSQLAANAYSAHRTAREVHAELLEQVARERAHAEAAAKLAALEPVLAAYRSMVDGLRTSVEAFADDYSRRVDELVAHLWTHRKDSAEAVDLAKMLGRPTDGYKFPTFENLLVATNARWESQNRGTPRHAALAFANTHSPHTIAAFLTMPIRKV